MNYRKFVNGLSRIIDNKQIQRFESIKFLGVFLDEDLTWKEHIKYIENKLAKNIGIIVRSKLK